MRLCLGYKIKEETFYFPIWFVFRHHLVDLIETLLFGYCSVV